MCNAAGSTLTSSSHPILDSAGLLKSGCFTVGLDCFAFEVASPFSFVPRTAPSDKGVRAGRPRLFPVPSGILSEGSAPGARRFNFSIV